MLAFGGSSNNAGGRFVSGRYWGFKDNLFSRLNENIMGNSSYATYPFVLHPKSRGSIKLRDSNPDHHPVIVPNYFHDAHDLDVLVN